MTKQEFIKTFTKDEIVEMLFSHWEFKRIATDICLYLLEKKSKKLLNDMDATMEDVGTKKVSVAEYLEKHKEWKKLDRQLNTLHRNFGDMEK